MTIDDQFARTVMEEICKGVDAANEELVRLGAKALYPYRIIFTLPDGTTHEHLGKQTRGHVGQGEDQKPTKGNNND